MNATVAETDAIQQERLRAMGQMASGIIHDINNALAPITLYMDALLEGELGLSDRGRRFLVTIQASIGSIEQTFARLRGFYRKPVAGEFVEVDPATLLDKAVQQARVALKPLQKEGAVFELRSEVVGELPRASLNGTDVGEALLNLALNAAEAMPRGGAILMRAWVEPDGVAGNPALAFSISDTGIGMNEEQRRRCTEPFYSTKGKPGTGLGLSMVHGIMRRHGGALDIESAPGKGTTVRLLFRLASAPKGTQDGPLAARAPLPAQ